MKKLRNMLYKIPLDKQLHYLYGFKGTALIFLIIIAVPALTNTLRVWEIGVIATVVMSILALGKEIIDNNFDKKDFYASIIGAFVGSSSLCLTLYVLNWTCRNLAF